MQNLEYKDTQHNKGDLGSSLKKISVEEKISIMRILRAIIYVKNDNKRFCDIDLVHLTSIMDLLAVDYEIAEEFILADNLSSDVQILNKLNKWHKEWFVNTMHIFACSNRKAIAFAVYCAKIIGFTESQYLEVVQKFTNLYKELLDYQKNYY